ncbi:MAG: MFS transporter [Bacteroidales bacterium]|nr:MFS transporter [Bacteroidales bacterium]
MIRKKNPFASFPVFLAFLCMGFGDVVGPLTGLIKQEFQLSNLMAQMIPFMGFLMFGLLSIPIGVVQDKYGKKSILLTGLYLALLGLMIPLIGKFSSFIALLAGILMLGAGATFLQVSGNPLMRDISAPGKYSKNLSLAQFIKAIGSLSGALIPLAAANYWDADWKILFPVYSVLVLLTIIWLWMTRIKGQNNEKVVKATFASSLSLLKNKYIFLMVLGIFLYVGAEVSMSSGLPIYLQDSFGLDIAKLGLLGTLFFFIALMTGRFIGAIILNWLSAKTFLKISVLVSIVGFMGLFAGVQVVAMTGIVMIGLGFANIFPLVFSITVDAMPARSNELSGLMVAAIVGGALIPPLMGLIADLTSTMIAFVVPLACVLFILSISFIKPKESISN